MCAPAASWCQFSASGDKSVPYQGDSHGTAPKVGIRCQTTCSRSPSMGCMSCTVHLAQLLSKMNEHRACRRCEAYMRLVSSTTSTATAGAAKPSIHHMAFCCTALAVRRPGKAQAMPRGTGVCAWVPKCLLSLVHAGEVPTHHEQVNLTNQLIVSPTHPSKVASALTILNQTTCACLPGNTKCCQGRDTLFVHMSRFSARRSLILHDIPTSQWLLQESV